MIDPRVRQYNEKIFRRCGHHNLAVSVFVSPQGLYKAPLTGESGLYTMQIGVESKLVYGATSIFIFDEEFKNLQVEKHRPGDLYRKLHVSQDFLKLDRIVKKSGAVYIVHDVNCYEVLMRKELFIAEKSFREERARVSFCNGIVKTFDMKTVHSMMKSWKTGNELGIL